MKIVPFLVIQFFVSFNSFTQKADTEVRDPKARVILDELSKITKAYSTIQAEFTYNLENQKEKINEKQSGVILLKGNKYKLTIAGQEITCDGKTQWTFINDAKEVTVDNAPDPNDNKQLNPANIFTFYEKDFKYQYDKEEVQGGKTIQWIKLFPDKANEKSYHTIRVAVDKEKKQLTMIQVLSKDGNKYTYIVRKFTPNTEVNDSEFTFDAKKAKEVIDLRE